MNKFIIFDLDGTLIDTLEGITKGLNLTLKELNISKNYSKEEVKTFIGNGAKKLLFLALKREFNEEEYSLYLKNYEKTQYISPFFKDVLNTLIHLKNKGYILIINSNKPDEILQKLIKNKFNGLEKTLFSDIKGQDSSIKRKPDPTYLNELINKLHLKKENGFYVGDSIVDILASKNLNIKSIIVSYGYGNQKEIIDNKPDYYIDEFKKVEEIVDKYE